MLVKNQGVQGKTQIIILVKLVGIVQSMMTLNYQVIVERYPFSNGVVGSSILVVKSSLYLIGKTS